MANRRFVGGSASKLGYSQQGYQGNKMSPWQGGNAPGNTGNSGIISSLSGPQAQLALAISSLLQPQSNPPSLLSLNTGPSSYNNQEGFGSQGRFDRGRDFRRPEPYNKNNQNRFGNAGWRDNSTRPLGGPPNRLGGGRSVNLQKGKFNRDKNQASRPKGAAKPNDSYKKEKAENDVSLDDSRDEATDKKRDWKREKKDDVDKQENSDAVDLTEDEENKEKGDKKPRDKEGRYKGVPASLLHCFVCSKSMWDGESFQNHLKGKAHKQMIDSLGQSFQVTVNILRENMRLTEEKKAIEIDRMSRSSRYRNRPMNEPKSHCNMCDLEFLGKIVAHRKTEGHQRLKRFLHPNCDHCVQEFPSRMEWLDHRLTPDHLRKVKEVLDAREGSGDGAPLEEEEAAEMNNDPLLDESIQAENEDHVLELTDDLKDLHNRIPAFKPSRPVAKANVKAATGFFCDICVRFMTSEEAAEEHVKTERHYTVFVEAAKLKFQQLNEEKERGLKRRQEEEAAEAAKKVKLDNSTEDAENKDSQDSDKYDPEEAAEEDSALDTSILDDETPETPTATKDTDQTASNGPEKEDVKPSVEINSPRGRRAAAPATVSTPASNVKNGAGPKSKARRGK